jgi:WD40 repeat protein
MSSPHRTDAVPDVGPATVDFCQPATNPAEQATLAPGGWLDSQPVALHVGAEAVPAAPAIPGYEIQGTLGRGGMGIVFKAVQTQLQRPVALKMILDGRFADAAAKSRFLAEAESLAKVRHPFVVQIHELGQYQGHPYFSLEYVGGGSLDAYLVGRPQAPRAAAAFVAKIADGIQAAHDAGIIHRDLKPANILLARPAADATDALDEVTPKITDFGLAKQIESGAGLTASGAIMGTPSYMAPEQAGGHTKAVTPATDVYALGAILYEMLIGTPPFKGADALATLMQVLEQDPVAPRQLRSEVPRDLETICLKCLAKDPARRYPTAGALADDLRRFCDDRAITARAEGPVERMWRWSKRNRLAAGLLTVLLAGVGALTAASWWALNEAARADRATAEAKAEKRQAEAHARTAETERQRTQTALAQAERQLYFNRIALADQEYRANHFPRMRQLLADCPPQHRHWEWRYLDRLTQLEFLTLRGHDHSRVTAVAFTPDGQRLVSAGDDGGVVIWDVATGNQVRRMIAHGGRVCALAVSQDGQRILTGGEDESAKWWDASTGECLLTLTGHQIRASGVAISSDGSRLATVDGVGFTLRLWDAATGRVLHQIKPSEYSVETVAFDPAGERVAVAGLGPPTIWNVRTGQRVKEVRANSRISPCRAVVWDSSGERLILAGWGAIAAVVDVEKDEVVHVLRGHGPYNVNDVATSQSDNFLVTGGDDKTVRVWNTQDDKTCAILRGHDGEVAGVAVAPHGKLIASASSDGTIKLWPLNNVFKARTTERYAEGFYDAGLAVTRDGRLFAKGSWYGFGVFSLDTGLAQSHVEAHQSALRVITASPDERWIVTTSIDGLIRVWDSRRLNMEHQLRGHAGEVYALAVSPDSRMLYSAGMDGQIRSWDLEAGTLISKWQHPLLTIHTLAASQDGKTLASDDADGLVHLWDTASQTLRHTWDGGDRKAHKLAFSPKAPVLAAGLVGGTIQLFDANDLKPIRTLNGHSKSVNGLAFSPDGLRLASTSDDLTVRIWDIETGEPALVIPLEDDPPKGVAFTPDGRRLVVSVDSFRHHIFDTGRAAESERLGVYHREIGLAIAAQLMQEHGHVPNAKAALADLANLPPAAKAHAAEQLNDLRDQPIRLLSYCRMMMKLRPRVDPSNFSYTRMLRAAQTLLQLAPTPEAREILLLAQYRTGRFHDAEQTLRDLAKLRRRPMYMGIQALLDYRLGRMDEAAQALESYRRIWNHPSDTGAASLAQQILAEAGALMAMPLSAEARQGLAAFAAAAAERWPREELVARLSSNPTLSPAARRAALNHAELFRDSPKSLADAARHVAQRADARPEDLARAMRQAQAAVAAEDNETTRTVLREVEQAMSRTAAARGQRSFSLAW